MIPGKAVTLTVKVERHNGFKGRVPISVMNLPHGVRVDDVGLNGVMIHRGAGIRRVIHIVAEPWVPAQSQPLLNSGARRSELAAPERIGGAAGGAGREGNRADRRLTVRVSEDSPRMSPLMTRPGGSCGSRARPHVSDSRAREGAAQRFASRFDRTPPRRALGWFNACQRPSTVELLRMATLAGGWREITLRATRATGAMDSTCSTCRSPMPFQALEPTDGPCLPPSTGFGSNNGRSGLTVGATTEGQESQQTTPAWCSRLATPAPASPSPRRSRWSAPAQSAAILVPRRRPEACRSRQYGRRPASGRR